MAETPLQVMKNKIHLTETVPSTLAINVAEDGGSRNVLVDYSKLKRNVLTVAQFAAREDWHTANNRDWDNDELWTNFGNALSTRMTSRVALSGARAVKLQEACVKLQVKIGQILNGDGKDGLRQIFEHKAQSIKANGQWNCGGGPKDFFRFLFNFAVPSKYKLRTEILEHPTAGTKSGQCWKVYGDKVNADGYPSKGQPKWADGNQMHCYICDIPLTLGESSSWLARMDKSKKNMQCEHLFPFTEGMLFWILYSNAIVPTDDYENQLREIQVREYAPVCQDCNCRLKSSIGILDLCGNWMDATEQDRDGIPIVNINNLHLQKIACNPAWDKTNWQPINSSGSRPTEVEKRVAFEARLQRLYDVFTPLVREINISLKNRGINTPKKLSQFLIYKYFSYFSDNVVDKIRVMLVGGESAKHLNNERISRNKVFGKMIKELSGFIKTLNKNITNAVNAVKKAAKKQREADRESASATSRQKSKKETKALAAQTATKTAEEEQKEQEEKKERVMTKIVSIFTTIFPGIDVTEDFIKEKITEINEKLRDNNNTLLDYVNDQNIDQAKQNVIDSIKGEIEGAMEGGGDKINKTKFIQSGGNIEEAFNDDVDVAGNPIPFRRILIDSYLLSLLAQYSAIETEETIVASKSLDDATKSKAVLSTEFASRSLAYLHLNVLGNNSYSINLIDDELEKRKKVINSFNYDEWVSARENLLKLTAQTFGSPSTQFTNVENLIIQITIKEMTRRDFLDSIMAIFSNADVMRDVNQLSAKVIKAVITVHNGLQATLADDDVCDINTPCDDTDTLEQYLDEIDDENNYTCIDTGSGNIIVDTDTLKINNVVDEAIQEMAEALTSLEGSKQTTIYKYFPPIRQAPTSKYINIYGTDIGNWSANGSLQCVSCSKTNEGIGILGTQSDPKPFSANNKVMHMLTKNGVNQVIFCPRCVKKIKTKLGNAELMETTVKRMNDEFSWKDKIRKKAEKQAVKEVDAMQRTLTNMGFNASSSGTVNESRFKKYFRTQWPTIQDDELDQTMKIFTDYKINSIQTFTKLQRSQLDSMISKLDQRLQSRIITHWVNARGLQNLLVNLKKGGGGSNKKRRKKKRTKRKNKRKKKTKRRRKKKKKTRRRR